MTDCRKCSMQCCWNCLHNDDIWAGKGDATTLFCNALKASIAPRTPCKWWEIRK